MFCQTTKEFGRFDSQPDALSRWIRDGIQWLKWSDASSRKHHFLDGGEGETAADSDLAACAELAALVRSGAANDGEVCAFIRRKFPEKKA